MKSRFDQELDLLLEMRASFAQKAMAALVAPATPALALELIQLDKEMKVARETFAMQWSSPADHQISWGEVTTAGKLRLALPKDSESYMSVVKVDGEWILTKHASLADAMSNVDADDPSAFVGPIFWQL